jgi:hypothetical protein
MLIRVAAAILSTGIIMALAGCVSPAELRREDQAACSSFGFTPGTTAFAACLQRESLARRYAWSAAAPWPYGPGPGWYPPPPAGWW